MTASAQNGLWHLLTLALSNVICFITVLKKTSM